jgi:hypothetical protein
MTDRSIPARARAESLFRAVAPEEKQTGMEEYRDKQQAELDKMARLRAARLEWQKRRLTFGSQTNFFHSPTSAKR